jgi:hypothetical protein
MTAAIKADFSTLAEHDSLWVRAVSRLLREAGFLPNYDHGNFVSFYRDFEHGKVKAFVSPPIGEGSREELWIFAQGFRYEPANGDLELGRAYDHSGASLMIGEAVRLVLHIDELCGKIS